MKEMINDEINKQYGAPKIYQYTETEKQRICFEDEDFERYIKRNFKSLRGWDKKLEEEISSQRPTYRHR